MGNQCAVERVFLDDRLAVQMSVTRNTSKQDLLQQICDCLWSKHKTDVGLVKSAQPVKNMVRPGARLLHQRQYPLTSQAIE